MSTYGVQYESKDKKNYGVFTVVARDRKAAGISASNKLRQRGKEPSKYSIILTSDEDEERE